MIWALFRKEVEQHGLVIFVLGLVTVGASQLVRIVMAWQGMAGSAFFGAGLALVTILPLACLILGHRLVVIEFRSKTQLFLEALPIARWKFIAVKYGLGLAAAVGYAVAAVGVTWVLAEVGDGKNERFLQILGARTAVWAACVFSFFFMMGFLGRYRVPVFVLLYFGLMIALEGEWVPVGEFPPFRLVDVQTFGFERDVFPVRALWWSGAVAAGLAAASFGLGLVREGSVASMLGEKMSHKEKMVIGGLLAGSVAMLSTLSMKYPDPFELPGAVNESREGVEVSVASPEEGAVDREVALAAALVDELAEAKRWCGASSWPEVFVVEREDGYEEGERFRLGELEDVAGVLVYADYRGEGFPEDRFVSFVLGACLEELSQGRVMREDRKWLALGMVRLWVDGSRSGGRAGAWDEWLSEARAAVEAAGFDEESVGRWLSYEEEVGEEAAKSVAWVGLRLVGERYGEGVLRALLAELLGRKVSMDARATLRDWMNPVPEVFERVTGEGYGAFVEAWREAIAGGEGGGS